MTRFCTTVPPTKLRFDAFGRAPPVGHTVRYPAALGATAAILRTTAPTPEPGTPPRPVTVRSSSAPVPMAPMPANWPSLVPAPERVSSRRAGVSAVSSDAAGNQPTTSAIRWVFPLELYRATWPFAPTLTIARFATVWPGTKLMLEARGSGVPAGHAVTYPAVLGSVTVRLSTTAPTPLAGTPPRPVTVRSSSVPARTAVPEVRVSSRREGCSGAKDEESGNQPATSATRSVLPKGLYSDTLPLVPSLVMTRLGMTSPTVKLRFEVSGRALPVGQAVMYPAAVGLTAVRLSTTAPAPIAGTPPRPATARSSWLLAPSAPPPANKPSAVAAPTRVSSTRAGTSDVNLPGGLPGGLRHAAMSGAFALIAVTLSAPLTVVVPVDELGVETVYDVAVGTPQLPDLQLSRPGLEKYGVIGLHPDELP